MAYQKIIIHGNLGKDPELKYTPSGSAVCNFSVAVGEKWKDKNDQLQEHVEWFRCSAFGKTAENLGKFFKKGSGILVEGKMRTTKFQDKQSGADRYSTDLIVSSFDFVGGKSDSGQSSGWQAGASTPPSQDFDSDVPF